MIEKTDREKRQVISFLLLRTFIGAIGIALPIVLVIGGSIYHGGFEIQDSISDYYQTRVRDIFVGILFVLSFFLLSYRGYKRIDNVIASFGFLFALGVALFPNQNPRIAIQITHFVSAGLMFSVFIYFSLYLFRKGKDRSERSIQKNRRNRIFFVCGIIMILCLLCIGLSFILISEEHRSEYKLVFIFETIALWAFGFSWLTKGKILWNNLKIYYLIKQ